MVGEYGGSMTAGNNAMTTFSTQRTNSLNQNDTWQISTASNIAKDKITLGM